MAVSLSHDGNQTCSGDAKCVKPQKRSQSNTGRRVFFIRGMNQNEKKKMKNVKQNGTKKVNGQRFAR
jgi:hypothetical protein